uniref:Uncharacterized protein n=1 Tax=Physcomitrium patens TaxID=3218 RepID=A0A2K1K1M4_PHYPA|nr:hypothetical protein PHYPA_012156 [Physcomitrium patens]
MLAHSGILSTTSPYLLMDSIRKLKTALGPNRASVTNLGSFKYLTAPGRATFESHHVTLLRYYPRQNSFVLKY